MKLFVTVGAEKRSFNRLIEIVDQKVSANIFPQDTFIQTGYSSYRPKSCPSCSFLNYHHMDRMIADAEVVISHAGMGTVILCLRHKRIPVLFPRKFCFKEHVDDHQLIFAQAMAKRGLALTALSADELQKTYLNYEELSQPLYPIPNICQNKELSVYLKNILLSLSSQKVMDNGY
jgi:UDP-N-acetylglucosamine transferase subunit ALG13